MVYICDNIHMLSKPRLLATIIIIKVMMLTLLFLIINLYYININNY